MVNIIVELSKYLMILLTILYTFECFTVFRKNSEKQQSFVFIRQNIFMFLNHFIAFVVMILKTGNRELIIFYGAQFIFLAATIILVGFIYPKASRLVTNNMCMLLSIGFIVLTRLSYTKSFRQFRIVVAAMIISLFVPVFIRKVKVLSKLGYMYVALGLGLLIMVTIFASIQGGALLAIQIMGISFQFSEFVKIVFVFGMASFLAESTKFLDVVKVTVLAAMHVLVLVYSTDLGAGLIFLIAYLMMLYVSSKKPLYLLGGLVGVSGAAVVAYQLFGHVKIRVASWQDPLAIYHDGGLQLSQSLFAIGTGSWFGLGLFQGAPNEIPVAEEDFIFSAIAEEMGGLYGICVILICMSVFIMIVNISMQIKNKFYKIVALGLGTIYGFQVFLTIGGAIKFIPSTGVTLPLVSYGGSSMVSTLIMFSIIQGLYILREDEGENIEKQKR
jgi:Bacterial cell division membrane protein